MGTSNPCDGSVESKGRAMASNSLLLYQKRKEKEMTFEEYCEESNITGEDKELFEKYLRKELLLQGEIKMSSSAFEEHYDEYTLGDDDIDEEADFEGEDGEDSYDVDDDL